MFDQTEANPATTWATGSSAAASLLPSFSSEWTNSSRAMAPHGSRSLLGLGIGQWFRYFTGVIEIVGTLLLLIPRAVTAGLVLLACTMAGASVIHLFVMGHPANAIITGAFLGGLIVFWLTRRDR